MKFYLMRHAEADQGEQLDPTRGLTPTGKRQAKMMAKWFDRQAEKPECLIQSNMRRSQQTAKRLAKQLDLEPVTSGTFDPDGDPAKAIKAMQTIGTKAGAASVLAVSHGPLVEEMLAQITGGTPDQFHFAHAAIAHWDDTGKFHWLVSPNTVARDEDESDNVTSDALIERAIISIEDALPLIERGEYYYDEVEEKRWMLGDGGREGNCEICIENEDMGWIDMDEVFMGVDGEVDEPEAHPNCTCAIEYRTRRFRVYVDEAALAVVDAARRLIEGGKIAA